MGTWGSEFWRALSVSHLRYVIFFWLTVGCLRVVHEFAVWVAGDKEFAFDFPPACITAALFMLAFIVDEIKATIRLNRPTTPSGREGEDG